MLPSSSKPRLDDCNPRSPLVATHSALLPLRLTTDTHPEEHVRRSRSRRRRRPYDEDVRIEPAPWGGVYPPAPTGGGILYGLEGGGLAPFEPIGVGPYGEDYRFERRTHLENSPTFGRRGDREVRRWARHHGYVVEGEVPRHPSRRRRASRFREFRGEYGYRHEYRHRPPRRR